MNHLIKNLMHVMEKKISLYDKYIMVLENEWECVVGYSLEPLQKILNEKNDLVERMQKLEADRFKLMKKIAETLGIPQEKLNLMKLAEAKETPWNKRLIKSRKKLLSQIAVINDLMERIKRLMDSSSLSFKRSIAFVHSADEMAASPYHANGRVMEGKTEGRMFSMDV